MGEHNRTGQPRQDNALPWSFSQILLRIAALILLSAVISWPIEAHAEIGVDSPLSSQQRARYQKAFNAAKAGKIDTAHNLLRGAKSKLARKVATWLHLTRSPRTPSFSELTNLIEKNPHWPQQRSLRRAAEAAISAESDNEKILSWFAKNPPISSAARIRFAKALFAGGQPNLGEVLVRQIWINNNLSRSEERRFFRRYRKILTEDDHIDRLDRLLWDRRRGAAQRMLSRVPPDERKLGFARMSLIGSAAGVDAAVAKVPPHLAKHPGLVFERVHWRRTKGFHERARELLWVPPQQLGRPEKWWRERRVQVRRLLRKGHVSEAYRMASAHGQVGRAEIAEAEWLAGWIAISFLNDPARALGHFVRGHQVVRFPISVARMAFWAGRAAAQSNKPDVAEKWYAAAIQHPMTFYAQLALARFNSPTTLSLPADPSPTAREATEFRESELVRATRLIAAVGEKKTLRRFILHLADLATTPSHHRLVGGLAKSLSLPHLGVAAAKIAHRKGVFLPTTGYPIIDLPPGRGPEDALLLAVARQESEFNPRAISHAGARGLMQLMPATAKHVARSIKVRYDRTRLIEDATYNATLGGTHLRDLVRDYRGSYVLALAAYNAGGGNVRRWVRAWGDPRDPDVDVIDWIELIPIDETRNYIQRVLENVQVYRYRLAGGTVPLGIVEDLGTRPCDGGAAAVC